jgi:hypothetical protein
MFLAVPAIRFSSMSDPLQDVSASRRPVGLKLPTTVE